MINKKNICFLILIVLVVLLLFYLLTDDKVEKNDNLVYIENFLDEKDFQKILRLDTNKNTFIKESFRYIKPLKRDSYVNDIFYSQKILNKLKPLLSEKIKKSEFPIEHRIYPIDSMGMRPHKDTLLYDVPQYEAIFTIRNKSSSYTKWIDDDGKLHKKWTKPNSMLIVKALGYEHSVTPPKTGEREILKMIYTQSDNPNDNYYREISRFNNIV